MNLGQFAAVAATALVLGGVVAGSTASAATVTISAYEQDGYVVLEGAGSVDLTGLPDPVEITQDSDTQGYSTHNGDYTQVVGRASANIALFANYELTSLMPLTPDPILYFSVLGTGDNFMLQSGPDAFSSYLMLNSGYVSDESINFTWILDDTTLFDLNLNFGTIAIFGNNTVTLAVRAPSVSEVPLPASALFLFAGIGGLGAMRRKRK